MAAVEHGRPASPPGSTVGEKRRVVICADEKSCLAYAVLQIGVDGCGYAGFTRGTCCAVFDKKEGRWHVGGSEETIGTDARKIQSEA